MRRYSLVLLLIAALLIAGSIERPGSASSAPPGGAYQGRTAAWWAHRAVHNRRQLNRTRQIASASNVTTADLTLKFACIHQYEGSWTADTGNGYYGGLQMDRQFQRTYGARLYSSKGTADHWTAAEQISVAIVAYASRGFSPWPNTRRPCGL